MNRTRVAAVSWILACLVLNACGSQGHGPKTWIDVPLDNTTAPLAPLTLMAHASDNSSVAGIAFYVNDELLVFYETKGDRLESRQHEWTPPEPGFYTIGANGINGAGDEGSLATAHVKILGTDEIQPTKTETLILTPTGTTTITSTTTLTYTPTGTVSVTPSITPTWTITPSITPTRTITPSPTMEPPVYTILPAWTLFVDVTHPTISYVGVNPDLIYLELCPGFEKITRLTVEATDEGGIEHIGAAWFIGTETGTVILNYVGASRYEVDIGPVNTTGILEIIGSAEDFAGNWTSFETQVTVKNCLE